MRTIERTTHFKRDYKREAKGAHRVYLDREFAEVVAKLAKDQPLASKHRDHPLVGEWKDFRDCHIRPDLLLIYRKTGNGILQLVRLGSHSELGL
jgi:mRNA interferase YafQ